MVLSYVRYFEEYCHLPINILIINKVTENNIFISLTVKSQRKILWNQN